MLANLNVVQGYLGDGVATNFAIPFVYQTTPQIKVYKKNLTTKVVSLQVEGNVADYQLTGATPPTTPLPTTVHMTVAPTNLEQVFIARVTDITQPTTFTGGISSAALEKALDRIVQLIQELDERADRTPMLAQTDSGTLSAFPSIPTDGKVAYIGYGTDGKLRKFSSDEIVSGSSSVILLNLPTDGKFGVAGSGATGTAGSITGVDALQTLADAFDRVENVLEKLAPARPPNLSAVPLSIVGSYSAFESGTGTARPVVIDITNPQIVMATGAQTGFYDGDSGTLTGTLDAVTVGSRALSTADDSGTYGSLTIVDDVDYWAGVAGKTGFWRALHARINAAALALGVHTASLSHTASGTSTLSFSVSDPGTPTISGASIFGTGTTVRVSGVPTLAVGSTITAGFTVNNAVRSHYSNTRIASASAAQTNAQNAPLPGTPPANGAAVAASIPLTVAAGAYSENVSVTAVGYNSKGGTGQSAITGSIRVDTSSNESARSKSGTGQYPAKGTGAALFGDAWVTTDLLSGNKELQALGGLYQYPPLVNYSGNLPVAGPDYSGLTPDSYANMRWATFNLGAKTAVSSVLLTIGGAINFGSTALVSGAVLYVLIDGAVPTNGWVDANAAFPGTGSPTNSGDQALDVANSSATVKKVTFGASVRTGNVWVRIGLPSGSTKAFSSITIS